MSGSRKLLLGPATSVPCRSCGCRVSVEWLPSVALLLSAGVVPFVAAVAAVELLSRIGPLRLGVLTGVFLLLLAICSWPFLWAYNRFVPLVVRGV